MPFVTSHSRCSAMSREPQISRPNSTLALRVHAAGSPPVVEVTLLWVVAIFNPSSPDYQKRSFQVTLASLLRGRSPRGDRGLFERPDRASCDLLRPRRDCADARAP